ncbi:MAG: COQ9 family protein [Rhodospirillales bacterium]|nr:COQ9 family protein [Rhodospirillales bacterium]
MNSDEAIRDQIVLATLPHVAFEGWSERALRAGAADAGWPFDELPIVFPGGAREMITHWYRYADRRMLDALEQADTAGMSTHERVAAAIRFRIEVNIPYREAVRRTLSFLALPHNVKLGLSSTYAAVDAIWYACGDTTTDFRFYTKRATLAGVYVATILYWIDDSSEDFVETWAFLDRRLAGASFFPRMGGRLRGMVDGLPRPFRVFGARGA